MLSWVTKFFKTEAKPKPKANPDLAEYFTTHLSAARRQALINSLEEVIVQPSFNQVEGVAMDLDSSPKNAFAYNQQRIPDSLFAWYASQSFIGYQACAIIAQQWLVNKACSIKGQDAVRNGYKVTVNDGTDIGTDALAAFVKYDKKFHVKKNLRQASKFNEIYGIRHVLFEVESTDPKYYEKPFNPDGITPGSYLGMSQIPPEWITPLLDGDAAANPASRYFYDPTFWNISGKKYHRTHFVILRGPEVADILKPAYYYGGISLTQRIMERVYASERTANEAPQLAMTKRLNVRHVDMKKAVANQKAFEEAIAVQQGYRDNFGTQFADLDETVTQLDTSLTDLDTTIMTQYQLVAATANVPATKLLGTSPKGFNATGEHEIKTYHEELESIQENDLSHVVDRHHICLIRSVIAPEFGIKPFEVDAVWEPLDVPTEKEMAEIQNIKADTYTKIQLTGSIDEYEIRDCLIQDENSGFSGLEPVERPADQEPIEEEESEQETTEDQEKT